MYDITNYEAKKKYCPFISRDCEGDFCMAWAYRYKTIYPDGWHDIGARKRNRMIEDGTLAAPEIEITDKGYCRLIK